MSLGSIAFCPAASGETEAPSLQYSGPEPVKGSEAADFVVGEVRHSHADTRRKRLADRHRIAMEAWYSHFKQDGNMVSLDIAYVHMRAMVALGKGRVA
jgi:hypothetical protein